jgi:hypothetical protein
MKVLVWKSIQGYNWPEGEKPDQRNVEPVDRNFEGIRAIIMIRILQIRIYKEKEGSGRRVRVRGGRMVCNKSLEES